MNALHALHWNLRRTSLHTSGIETFELRATAALNWASWSVTAYRGDWTLGEQLAGANAPLSVTKAARELVAELAASDDWNSNPLPHPVRRLA